MNLSISPGKAGQLLTRAIAFLTLASVGGQFMRFELFGGHQRWYIALFDLNRELNIPTFYQGMTLFTAAVLLVVIACHQFKQRDSSRWQWAILASMFFLLSADEMCQFHDQLGLMLDQAGVSLHGLVYYAWVIPAIIIVLIVGLMFLPFVFRLPSPTRMQFIVAGLIYVGGALGMEMVGGWYDDLHGGNNLTCQLIANVEEFMEMAGIAMFIVSLLQYIGRHLPQLTILVRLESPVVQSAACRPDLKPSRAISQPSGLMPS